jgi:C-terminal processing protease CtpA/Prc
MKSLLLVCLLGMSAASVAQTVTTDKGVKSEDARRATDESRRAAEDAKRAAEEANRTADEDKKRAELEAARTRLDQATREVMALSQQLAENSRGDLVFFSTDRRAMLGVQIDPQSGREGARVRSVSPGGPAADAGLAAGDVIVALDGKTVTGGDDAGRALIDQMRNVTPDQKVKVRVIRAGKNKDLIVIARPFTRGPGFDERTFSMQMPEMVGPMGGVTGIRGVPMVRQLRFNMPGEFEGLELASITPKLGAYFGASDGVLVVQAPQNGAFKLEDGDVIQAIDGRKPEDGTHALRILRSYSSGEKLKLTVLRQRKPMTIAVTMPDHPDTHDFMDTLPLPALPAPPAPPAPASPGTDQ